LRGAAETRPLHWSADRDEIQDFELTIRELQAGTGLIADRSPNPTLGAPNAGLSADLDALAAFVDSLRFKASPFRAPGGALTSAAQRGEAIFLRSDVGCGACHVPPDFTDTRDGVAHDVGTGDGADEAMGPMFDTPTLRGVWDTAPYLHDGSAPTLRHVLTTRNASGRHGQTSHLTPNEIDDLVEFLRSL
jgi:cytochrome c peroxidase